jgi:hypothetical protein
MSATRWWRPWRSAGWACLRADTRGWRCVADFLRSGASEQVVTLAAPRAAEASI